MTFLLVTTDAISEGFENQDVAGRINLVYYRTSSSLLVVLFTRLLDLTTFDLHPAITLATRERDT